MGDISEIFHGEGLIDDDGACHDFALPDGQDTPAETPAPGGAAAALAAAANALKQAAQALAGPPAGDA
jgi:hypothetical protein